MGRPTIHQGCAIEGCDRPHKAQGYCASHYKQFKRGVEVKPLIAREYHHGVVCSIEGCGALEVAKGYCQMHYKRLVRHGSVDSVHRPWELTK